jgi:hypothetical protein
MYILAIIISSSVVITIIIIRCLDDYMHLV